MRMRSVSTLTAALLAAAILPAGAQAPTRAGILECTGGFGNSYLVGSTRQLTCVFKPQARRRPETYAGMLSRAGVDVGWTATSGVTFAVVAPAGRVRRGELVGSYGGLSAGASVGVGARANWLVGGPQNRFMLQPLTLEGQTGLNAAAGFAGFELRAM